ncbi:DUF2971 domain-containing protein [Photobacterium damselae subsp. damselae]|uniref:DUF2971 domain-containing protein n=1 Tax=Photobacterium damselae TaxID=38293 RepID=UPI00311B3C64
MKVYKYTPDINRFLVNPSLKLTPTSQLNDPFKAKPTKELIESYDAQMEKSFNINSKIFSKNYEDKDNPLNRGVISLSESELDIRMFTHYANEHTGGYLEFEIDELKDGTFNKTDLFENHDDNYMFGRVNYYEDRPHHFAERGDSYITTGIYFDKAQQWSHEREVRYVASLQTVDSIVIPKKDFAEYQTKEQQNYIQHYKSISYYLSTDELSTKYIIHTEYEELYFEKEYTGEKTFIFETEIKKLLGDQSVIDYRETKDNIIIKIDLDKLDYQPWAAISNWNRFVTNVKTYHPLLRVNKEKLTGIYLGCRFNTATLKTELLPQFPNLNNNVKATKISSTRFSLEITDL